MSYLCQNAKKLGGHPLRFKDKACGKLPNFENLAHVIQHGLQGFIVKNIESKVSERRSHFVEVGLLRK